MKDGKNLIANSEKGNPQEQSGHTPDTHDVVCAHKIINKQIFIHATVAYISAGPVY